MVDFAHIAGLDDHGDLGARVSAQQMVLHRGGEQATTESVPTAVVGRRDRSTRIQLDPFSMASSTPGRSRRDVPSAPSAAASDLIKTATNGL